MFFFRAELSLFDEDKETIFLIPNDDGLPKDELPLFSESELTAHPKFTAFVKRTKTAIVDIEYELYEAKDVVLEEITEEKFDELLDAEKLELLDSNNYCIQTRKIHYKKQKNSSLFPKIGIGAAVLLLIMGAAAKKMRAKNQPSPGPVGEITSEVVYSSESSAEEPTDDESSLSVSDITESATSSSSEQSTVQSRGSSVTPTANSVKPTSSAVSSSRSSTSAARNTAQISSSTAVSLKAPIEATTSR